MRILKSIPFLLIAILFFGCTQSTNSNSKKEIDSTSTNTKIDSQKEINFLLAQKIKLADTILLVSHTGNSYDKLKDIEIPPTLLFRNKINKKILHEQKVLSKNNIDTLIQILLMPTNNDSLISARCYYPHHAIFIISKGQISYIDICFHCFSLSTSEDLDLGGDYDEAKWEALLSFYKKLNFKYEMP